MSPAHMSHFQSADSLGKQRRWTQPPGPCTTWETCSEFLVPGPALASAALWPMNQQMEEHRLFFSVSVTLLKKYMHLFTKQC